MKYYAIPGEGSYIAAQSGAPTNKDYIEMEGPKPDAGFVAYAPKEGGVLGFWASREIYLSVEEKLLQVDEETSATILAGFDYEIQGKPLHFSYDQFDQGNFADTANVATLVLMGVPNLPKTVSWSGWEKKEDGSFILHELVLTPEEFLALYTQGALKHKILQMTLGRQRKEAILNQETGK